MAESQNPPSIPDAIEAAAAQWLARLDRGLNPREQAELKEWQQADPRHAAALDRLEKVWRKLDQLAEQPSTVVSFPAAKSVSRPRARWAWIPLLAAAAAGVIAYFSRPLPAESPAHPHAIFHPGPERLALEDGSAVELKSGAKVEVQFTPTERRVRLVQGEAFFTVAKNPARPFIVSTGQVAVRAVGTAFSVGLGAQEISVLVTEGRVRVNETAPPTGDRATAPRGLAELGVGQQGVIALTPVAGEGLEVKVTDLDAIQIDRALSWQGPRLEFDAIPLGDVVAEFNRYNRHERLVIHDAATAAILIGGNFRADNVEAFIRLLKVGFGVSAFPRGGNTVLLKVHDA